MDNKETNSGDRVVTIEKLVYGGDGLARDEGRVTMTPFVLPGEQVRVSIAEDRGQFRKGRVAAIEKASEQRVEAACKYFGRCGGCHYQHAQYEYQIEQKKEILREAFTRVGKLPAPEQIEVLSGPPYGYRNRVQLHIEKGKLGYHELGSHKLLDVEECPISSPRILEALAALRSIVKDRRFPRFVRTLELFSNEVDVQVNVLETEQPVAQRFFDWCAEVIPGYATGSLVYPAVGFDFRVSFDSFFQVNRFLIEPLVETALAGAEGESAIDMYSGVGLFTLPLAKRFKRVTAVETGSSAVRDLEQNAKKAELTVNAYVGQVDAFLRQYGSAVDFVVADPPRAGLGKQVVAALLASPPKRLHIVSCDPSTLARDLAPLLAEKYALESVTIADLFPQTYHIETIVKLVLQR
jgi:23S rRNA (uracil1939-C5)-methyltransferase